MRFLRLHGYDVRAFDSAEAWLVSIFPADCAIVDINLLGLSGFELDEQLRVKGLRIPTVFITAHDEPRARGPLPPRWLILHKPLDEKQLLEAIDRANRGQ